MATLVEESEMSVDIRNWQNTASRWSQAIEHYTQNCSTIRAERTADICRCNAIIDISGSMEGKKLIAVKLGLCSLIANFSDMDEMNITAFSGRSRPVTDGFLQVAQLREVIPRLLENLQVDGCTACYDAVIQGIKALRTRCDDATDSAPHKNVTIVLTDGDDNESKTSPLDVERHLCSPGINSFMFIMVAVAMSAREEKRFRNWMDLGHCKQISVNVKTGTSLVGVFKEMLLSRILQSDVATSGRFLEHGGVAIEADACVDSEAFASLRNNMLRGARGGSPTCDEGGEEDGKACGLYAGYHSDGVSCVDSCSDNGDDDGDVFLDDFEDIGDDFESGSISDGSCCAEL
jgi:uncharacterized protein YegL